MGRKLIELDEEVVFDTAMMGLNQKEAAEFHGVSTPTLAKRIAMIQDETGILMKYRALQSLQLTSLQAKILEAVTSDKIAEASLTELVQAFKILKDKELVADGKHSDIKGLVAYLIHIEKEKVATELPVSPKIIDAQVTKVVQNFGDGSEELPDL